MKFIVALRSLLSSAFSTCPLYLLHEIESSSDSPCQVHQEVYDKTQ